MKNGILYKNNTVRQTEDTYINTSITIKYY